MQLIKCILGIIFLSTVTFVSINQISANNTTNKEATNNIIRSNNTRIKNTLGLVGHSQYASSDSALVKEIDSLQIQVDILSQVVSDLKLQIVQFHGNGQGYVDDYDRHTMEETEKNMANLQWQDFNDDNDNFINQSNDSSWGTMKEEALQNKFSEQSELLPENILESLECRSSSCRLNVITTNNLDGVIGQIILKSQGIFTAVNIHYLGAGDAVIFFSKKLGV